MKKKQGGCQNLAECPNLPDFTLLENQQCGSATHKDSDQSLLPT